MSRKSGFSFVFLILAFSLILSVFSSGSAFPASLVIKAGTVMTMTNGAISRAAVIIKDGKIVSTASWDSVKAPPDAKVFEFPDGTLMPGMIDAHCYIGLVGLSTVPSIVDLDESTDPITPSLRAEDGINPADKSFEDARKGGVTSAFICPGDDNVVGGQGAFLKLNGNIVDKMLVKSSCGMQASIGERPKGIYSKKGRKPSTRMGEASVLRDALLRAQAYVARMKNFQEKKLDREFRDSEKDMEMESLRGVLSGEMPLVVDCHRASDIATAMRLASELNLKLILSRATEAHLIADEIAARKIPVIVGPVRTAPSSMEKLNASLKNAAILNQKGVKIAFQTGSSHSVESLPIEAAFAVANGLDRNAALRALTIDAAEILGVQSRVGSIEPGKDADLVVFDGDPLALKTRAKLVIIGGEIAYSEK
ncbi:MAG: amidohydrolase family protein [Candidatus Eisenbacteria bacterium]|nr:amidohydrolase family protein [Candidatus Eisenbacteria bacterium]